MPVHTCVNLRLIIHTLQSCSSEMWLINVYKILYKNPWVSRVVLYINLGDDGDYSCEFISAALCVWSHKNSEMLGSNWNVSRHLILAFLPTISSVRRAPEKQINSKKPKWFMLTLQSQSKTNLYKEFWSNVNSVTNYCNCFIHIIFYITKLERFYPEVENVCELNLWTSKEK